MGEKVAVMTGAVQQGQGDVGRRDIVLRLEGIADASLREDGTDIPLGEQLREAAREITRLRTLLSSSRGEQGWRDDIKAAPHGKKVIVRAKGDFQGERTMMARFYPKQPFATPWPTDEPPLTRSEIERIQERLAALGFDPGPVDGTLGNATREALRRFFEVDRYWVTLAALKALADDGSIERSKVAEAIAKYGIDINKPNPVTV